MGVLVRTSHSPRMLWPVDDLILTMRGDLAVVVDACHLAVAVMSEAPSPSLTEVAEVFVELGQADVEEVGDEALEPSAATLTVDGSR